MDNNMDNNNQYTEPNVPNDYGNPYPNPESQNYDSNYGNGNPYNNDNTYNYNNNMYGNGYTTYGNSGQYGNMGGEPLDKNGRPIPNRFGMKLTFSILEMISCTLLSLIMGIIACVFTCKANTAYKERRWEDFRRQAKTSAILLWVGLAGIIVKVILIIIVIAYSTYIFKEVAKNPEYSQFMEEFLNEVGDVEDYDELKNYIEKYQNYDFDNDNYLDDYYDESFQNDYDDDMEDWDSEIQFTELGDYYAFELEGKRIELPIYVSTFMEMGFTLDRADPTEYMVNAGEIISESYYNANGDYLGALDIMNAGSKAVDETACVITGMSIYNDTALAGEYKPSIQFANGFTFDTPEQDVLNAFGTPGYEYHSDAKEDYVASDYEWYPPSYQDTYYNELGVDYWDGVMESVYIYYQP